ncbi:MAG: sensor histidine kinase, partial [Janthinobacterium lividum]
MSAADPDPWVSRRRFAARARDGLAVLLSLVSAAVWFYGLVMGPFSAEPGSPPIGGPLDLPLNAPSSVAGLVLAVAASLSLWWRRSRPLLLCIVLIAVSFALAFDGAMFFALLTVAVRRRDRLLVVLSVVAFVASAQGAFRTSADGWFFNILSAAFMTALCVFVGAFVGARRDLVRTLRERAERAEHEQTLRGEQSRLAERTRIAREMHDVLAHRISLVALHAGGLEVRPDVGPAQVEATAATIRETARSALEDLRRVLGVLRAPDTGPASMTAAELTPQPTLLDLRGLVESSREAGVAAEFRT